MIELNRNLQEGFLGIVGQQRATAQEASVNALAVLFKFPLCPKMERPGSSLPWFQISINVSLPGTSTSGVLPP